LVVICQFVVEIELHVKAVEPLFATRTCIVLRSRTVIL
jgi:hypothetical protein